MAVEKSVDTFEAYAPGIRGDLQILQKTSRKAMGKCRLIGTLKRAAAEGNKKLAIGATELLYPGRSNSLDAEQFVLHQNYMDIQSLIEVVAEPCGLVLPKSEFDTAAHPDPKVTAYYETLNSGRYNSALQAALSLNGALQYACCESFEGDDFAPPWARAEWESLKSHLLFLRDISCEALESKINKELAEALIHARIKFARLPAEDVPLNERIDPKPRAGTSGAEYPSPEHYARDKWIYENIACNSFAGLQLKLKAEAKKKKYVVISSRPGLKKAADRYAQYHKFDKRRFSS